MISRLITHAAYYLTGDTVTFLHSIKQAVLRRGLLHAKPYHASSKGKVERLIRTIQQDFEATLRLEKSNRPHTLRTQPAALPLD